MSQVRKVRATESFSAGLPGGGDRMISGGQIFDADDPIVAAFPGLFERLVEVIPEPPVKRAPRGRGKTHG